MASIAPQRQPGTLTGIALLLPITLSTMAIVLLAPILPKMLDEFRHVPAYRYWVPMVLTVPALCVALLSPVAGVLGDYYGRRRLLIVSFVGYAAVGIAPLFLTSLMAILVSRIGVGVFEALIMVLTTTMIGDYFKGERRDRWLAAQTAAASISALVFFNLGGQLGAFGWRTPFWIYLSALGMLALVLAFTWEPSERDPMSEAAVPPRNSSWRAFPWSRFAPVLAATVYSSVFFYTVQIQAGVGLSQLGMTDPARIGFVTSVASIGVPLGTLVYARLNRDVPARLLVVELVILAVGFFIMSRATTPLPLLIGCFVNQFGAGMLLPTLLVQAMGLLDFEVRGRGAGLWQASFAIGQFCCPIIVTFLSETLHGLFAAFLVLAIAAAAGALLIGSMLLRRRTPVTAGRAGSWASGENGRP